MIQRALDAAEAVAKPEAPMRASEGRVRVYFEPRDWWIGLYIGPEAWYICVLPTLVLRIPR